MDRFPFAMGELPVKYLGLQLLTKRMTKNDYAPLIEKLRNRLSSWMVQFLSYAGRLQLLKSVILDFLEDASKRLRAYDLPFSGRDQV